MNIESLIQKELNACIKVNWHRPNRCFLCVNRNESEPELWHAAGLCAWLTDDFDLAQYRFKRAIALADSNASYHNNLGNALQGIGSCKTDAYQKALDLDPNYAQAWTNLGVAKQELQRLDDALLTPKRF